MPDWLATCGLLAGGGAVGTLARYWLGVLVKQVQQARWPLLEFPVATLLINVSGSMILGFVAAYFLSHPDPARRSANLYLLLGAGFCGGFTTFSTFSLEAFELIRDERWGSAIAYTLGSVVAGIFGVWLALRIAK
ncbi:MAG TPA: fluoride efflux transporter CrcB [Urbifossiella sp.]|nr:fluoride efflux transporter CrcB [Urbifossiella sp.]